MIINSHYYSGLEKAWDKMEEKYKESFGKAQQQVKNINIYFLFRFGLANAIDDY